MIKVGSFHQLIPQTCQLITSEGLDGVAEDKSFDNHPVNLQRQHLQVQNVTPLKSDTDDKGRQLPLTHTLNLTHCYYRKSQSCLVNCLHLAQTTSS